MTRLIGINGRLRSGKDTAYEIIAAEKPNVKRTAFADMLKLSAAWAAGYNPSDVEDAVNFCNKLKETGMIHLVWDDPIGMPRGFSISGREYLQRYGTEAHRDVFGDNFWVNACLPDNWADKHGNPDILVITDVRFLNEAQRIRELGGEVWCISADERLGKLPEGSHISEYPLSYDNVDAYVDNNGTQEQFRTNVQEALAR